MLVLTNCPQNFRMGQRDFSAKYSFRNNLRLFGRIVVAVRNTSHRLRVVSNGTPLAESLGRHFSKLRVMEYFICEL